MSNTSYSANRLLIGSEPSKRMGSDMDDMQFSFIFVVRDAQLGSEPSKRMGSDMDYMQFAFIFVVRDAQLGSEPSKRMGSDSCIYFCCT